MKSKVCLNDAHVQTEADQQEVQLNEQTEKTESDEAVNWTAFYIVVY